MIEVNLPNEMDGNDYGDKPPYACWGESNEILNMHINPEEEQSFTIDVDKSTHELVIGPETEGYVVIKVKPKNV